MKKHLFIACVVLLAIVLTACDRTPAPTPDPEPGKTELDTYPELVAACHDWKTGGGKQAVGGNSDEIYHVTSLDDKSVYEPVAGTLRYAVMQKSARIIVFDVAGTIHLKGPLELTYGNVTILGQSAPGEGICVADYPLIVKGANNVVIRFMRFRLGNASLLKDNTQDYDAVSINDSRRVILDHCSASWSVDECVSCYGNEDFTMQYCFVTEALRNAGHVKGAHGYGGIWGGKNATFHHNLLAHNDSRNPRFNHDYTDAAHRGPIDFVNNVVYNWGDNSTYGGESVSKPRQINMVANYYKAGPSCKSDSRRYRLVDPTVSCSNCNGDHPGSVVPAKFYLTGNYMYGSTDVTENNWAGSTVKTDAVKADVRWTSDLTMLADEQTAEEAYETVLAKAGCSLRRDAVDKRIVEEVRSGKGSLIDLPSDVGGWPDLDVTSEIVDTDKDGIPDAWETKYGLDPNNKKDARKISLVTGHTNLEVYLCDLVKDLY